MAKTAATADGSRLIRVWDLPTRLFHWSLVVLVAIAWFTGEGEGQTAALHRYVGEAVAGLIVFRVIWGFIGGEHSRFSDFAAGPSAIAAHVRNLISNAPVRHIGHNPLGGVAVFLLLATTGGLVITGLFAGGEHSAGPFAGVAGIELSSFHEPLFRLLQGLVAIHILGVVVETIRAKDALAPAMITGRKRRTPDETGSDARKAGAVALLVAAGLGVLTSMLLIGAPPSSYRGGGEASQGGNDD